MSVVIREANLEEDQERIVHTLSKNLPPVTQRLDRFRWLYIQNSSGQARCWLAIDSETEECVGAAAAFPRRLIVNGQGSNAWVLGDFCLNKEYRSLGPALMLQRKCLESLHASDNSLAYDFPSQAMMRVYTRLRIPEFGKMIRWAKPLRIDHKVQDLVKIPSVAGILSKGGNFLLKSLNQSRVVSSSLQIMYSQEKFNETYSHLAQEVSGRYGICIERSAQYLNWRYRENPLYDFEVMEAHQDEKLVGWAIYQISGEYATIVDFLTLRDQAILSSLLCQIIERLYTCGIMTVSAPMIEGNIFTDIFRQIGFTERESVSIVVDGVGNQQTIGKEKEQGRSWFLMEGDRDS